MRFAVFVSGNGSNLQAIIEAVRDGQIAAELALVVSDKPEAYALKRAESAGIPVKVFNPKDYTNKQSVDRDMVIHLKNENIEFVVLAGYMRMLTAFFVKEFPNQIMNVHPSLLPAFKGARAIKDAFTYGVKVTGVTIHFVNAKMDAGPIILQKPMKLAHDETLESLEERIHVIEHRLYTKAIALYVDGRLQIKGRKVTILPAAKAQKPAPADGPADTSGNEPDSDGATES